VNKEEFRRELKALAVTKAREIIANQEENRKTAETAVTLFQALRDAPTWTVAMTQKPKDFTASPEIWTQKVTFADNRKEGDDNTSD
jgi:hypothetical protein